MLLRVLIYAAGALLLVACASPAAPPTTEAVVERTLPDTTGSARGFGPVVSWEEVIAEGAVEDGWLRTFGDPELERIVDEALRNNLKLATASANLEAAAQLAVQAGAALAPAVAVGGGTRSVGRGSATANSVGAALNVAWELDTWGRLSSAAAEEEFRASGVELEAARQSLVAQTAKAWFLATEANLQLALSQEAVEIYEQTLTIVETRFEAGAASPQDLVLAGTDLNAAKARQRQAIGALTQAMRSIQVILGRFPSAELLVAREFVPTPPAIPAGVPAELLERRPDLIAAQGRVAAAFRRVEPAKAAKLPSLSLTASGGSSSNELIELIGAGGNFFALGANFVAPLDTGGGFEVPEQIETAQQEAALASYAATALCALIEVENGLTNDALLRERERLLGAAVDNNANVLAAVKARYDAGGTDFLSVLQMQAQAVNSRISLIRIKNARLAQRVDLHLALGGSFAKQ